MLNQSQLEPTMQVLSAFVNADNWLESKQIVEQAQALLLTDEAESACLALIANYEDNEEMMDILIQHIVLLRACRDYGIEAAFRAKIRPAAFPDILPELTERFLAVESDEELAQLLHEHPELLPVLEAAQKATAKTVVDPRLGLADKLEEFIDQKTWNDSRSYLEKHPELLSDDALNIAQILIQEAEEEADDKAVRIFREHHELLVGCREQGIEATFAEKIDPTAQTRIMRLIKTLLECNESRAVLELVAKEPILLTDGVEQILLQSINNNRAKGTPEGEAMAGHVEARLASLRQARQMVAESGMTAQQILEEVRVMDEARDETLEQAMLVKPLQAFVMSDNWLEARQIVEENPNLLSIEADIMLAQWVIQAQAQSNPDAAHHLQAHRERLARARREGLDAIAPAKPAEVRSWMEQWNN